MCPRRFRCWRAPQGLPGHTRWLRPKIDAEHALRVSEGTTTMDESIAKVVSRLRHTRSAVGNAIETNETSRPTGRWPRWRARTERALLAKVLGRINDDLLWLEVKYSNLTASSVAGDVETPASRERAAKTAASQSVPDKLQIERLHELLPKICNAVIGGTDDRPAGVAATGKAPAGEAPSEEYLWSLEGNLRYELESLAGLRTSDRSSLSRSSRTTRSPGTSSTTCAASCRRPTGSG